MNKVKTLMKAIVFVILPMAAIILFFMMCMEMVPKHVSGFGMIMIWVAEGLAITVLFVIRSKEDSTSKGEGK